MELDVAVGGKHHGRRGGPADRAGVESEGEPDASADAAAVESLRLRGEDDTARYISRASAATARGTRRPQPALLISGAPEATTTTTGADDTDAEDEDDYGAEAYEAEEEDFRGAIFTDCGDNHGPRSTINDITTVLNKARPLREDRRIARRDARKLVARETLVACRTDGKAGHGAAAAAANLRSESQIPSASRRRRPMPATLWDRLRYFQFDFQRMAVDAVGRSLVEFELFDVYVPAFEPEEAGQGDDAPQLPLARLDEWLLRRLEWSGTYVLDVDAARARFEQTILRLGGAVIEVDRILADVPRPPLSVLVGSNNDDDALLALKHGYLRDHMRAYCDDEDAPAHEVCAALAADVLFLDAELDALQARIDLASKRYSMLQR